MQFPEFLYGTYREVSVECGQIASALKAGKPWAEATERDVVSTEENTGLILLDGPTPELPGKNYHVYCLFFKILSRIPASDDRMETIFQNCLDTPWGVLSLMSGRGLETQDLFHEYRLRRLRFLRAVMKYFDLFIAEGDRFLDAGLNRCDIWKVDTNLRLVLALHGVNVAELKSPLPSGGLAQLLAKHNVDTDFGRLPL